MGDMLSQDLPDEVETIDILWPDEPELTGAADIIPEEVTDEVTTEEETKSEETPEEPVVEETNEELTLESILGESEDIQEEVTDIADKAEEVKETVEEVKDALQSDDTDTAEKLIDDLYSQVFNYATELDTINTKYGMLQSKLWEMSRSNADYELQIAQSTQTSSDPKMIVLNRMYWDANEWKEFAKEKVISTLEDMYYNLTGQSFEEKRIDWVSDTNAEDVVLNNNTTPTVTVPQEEEVDLNDISSIF